MRRRPESRRATGRQSTRSRTATPGTASRLVAATYWCLPLVLAAVLWQLSLASSHAIRHEEVVESVRNVLWLDDRLIYDGVYSNVGWYGTLLVSYKLFGFSLTTAKVVRLVIYVAGLYASAVVLRRYLSPVSSAVPLTLLGASPTVLYFGSQQTSFGLDLSYAGICLALVLWSHPRDRPLIFYAKWFLSGTIAMVAAMSYPTFLVYLPSLAIVAVWHLMRERRAMSPPTAGASWWLCAVATGVGALVPLVAALLYVRSPQVLLLDPETGAGLFRGGGQLGWDAELAWRSLASSLQDLFVQGRSYYYSVRQPDFSGLLPSVACAVVVAATVGLAVRRVIPAPLAAALALLAGSSLAVPSLAIDGAPGIRRGTGLLIAFSAAFALVWHASSTGVIRRMWLRGPVVGACLLLPLLHVWRVPSLAADLARPDAYGNRDWFAVAATPNASLQVLRRQLSEGRPLACPPDGRGGYVPCRFQEVYAAIEGFRRWNRLPPAGVPAIDWRSGNRIDLSSELWNSGYYPKCTRLEWCQREMEALGLKFGGI